MSTGIALSTGFVRSPDGHAGTGSLAAMLCRGDRFTYRGRARAESLFAGRKGGLTSQTDWSEKPAATSDFCTIGRLVSIGRVRLFHAAATV